MSCRPSTSADTDPVRGSSTSTRLPADRRRVGSHPNELVSRVVDDVVAAGIQRRCVLLAFEWDALRLARELCSEIATDFLTLNPASVVAQNRKIGAVDPYLLYGAYDNLWNVASNDAAPTTALALHADAITLSDPDLLVQKLAR